MKLRTLICGFAFGAATMLLTSQVASMTTMTDSDEDLRQAFKKAAARSDFSKKLRTFRGQYRQEIKWWRANGAAPVDWKSRSTVKRILNDRFITQEVKGTWLGTSFEAMVILGYDGTAQQYTAVWMDTLGTRMLFSHGTLDESGKSVTMRGEYADPITREPIPVRTVFTIPERKGGLTVEMFRPDADGTEFKFIEVDSQRFVPTAG